MFLGFKHSRAGNTIPGTDRKRTRAETGTMQVSGARYARISISRIPLLAIFRFAIIGFGGALFLFYSFFGTGDAIQFAHLSGSNAPDAEAGSLSAVPDPSTWVFAVALVALVGVRWVHARWRRSQRLAKQNEARSHAPARGCTR